MILLNLSKHALLAFSLVAFSSWAYASPCDKDLESTAQSNVIRFYPWPVPTEEMMGVLKQLSEDRNNPVLRTDDFFLKLKEVLKEEDPEKIVHAIFDKAKLEKIRRHFGVPEAPTEIEIPGVATLTFFGGVLNGDAYSMRQALAYSIRGIKDDALKASWIEFMIKDDDSWTKNIAANAFGTFSIQDLRDQFAKKYGGNWDKVLDPKGFVAQAVAANLARVSPKLRWQLIKERYTGGGTSGSYAKEALASFAKQPIDKNDEQTLKLQSWFEDQVEAGEIHSQWNRYSPDFINKKPWGSYFGETAHDESSREIAQALNAIKNLKFRKDLEAKMTLSIQSQPEKAALVRDVLSFMTIFKIIEDYEIHLTALGDYKRDSKTWMQQIEILTSNQYQRKMAQAWLESPTRKNNIRSEAPVVWSQEWLDQFELSLK